LRDEARLQQRELLREPGLAPTLLFPRRYKVFRARQNMCQINRVRALPGP
jgi:hypothetical protein